MRLPTLAAALAAACLALPAAAILTRADRDDEEYRELATRYPAAVVLPGGMGALVAPRWILTTAALAGALSPKASIAIGGRSHEVERAFPHPSRDTGVALVLLRAPVEGIEPAAAWRGDDEAGRTARIVGAGATGRIGAAGAKPDGRVRAAINTIDRVAAATFGMRLKGTEDASDLQGALAAGDAGAPAFVESGGRILVAGIALGTADTNGDGVAGSVGDWETYARVSAVAGWIDAVIAEVAAAEAAAAVGDTERR